MAKMKREIESGYFLISKPITTDRTSMRLKHGPRVTVMYIYIHILYWRNKRFSGDEEG